MSDYKLSPLYSMQQFSAILYMLIILYTFSGNKYTNAYCIKQFTYCAFLLVAQCIVSSVCPLLDN